MNLSGAAVTRILEELQPLNEQVLSAHHAYSSYGDVHRAVEDFINVLVNEILPKERHVTDHR